MVDRNRFVRVTATVETGGFTRLTFGRGLLITTSGLIPAGGAGKATLYNSLDELSETFPSGDVYDAAAVWFAADPPPQGLYVGRWAADDVSTILRGVPTVAVETSPLNSNAGTFQLDGTDFSVDLSSDATYGEIAAALQTALDGVWTGTTCTYSTASGFEITFADARAVDHGRLIPTGAGTDISVALGFAEDATGRVYLRGHDEETIGAGVAEMIGLAPGGQPTVVMLDAGVPATFGDDSDDTRLSLAAAAETGAYVFVMRETADAALTAGETGSHAAQAYAAQYGETAVVFGGAGELPDVGLAAAMSAQNFDLPASVISPQAIALPGVQPYALTTAELEALTAKRASAYTLVGGQPAFVGGYTSRDGYWLDAIVFLTWLRSEVESALWGGIRSARRYTAATMYDDLSGVMERAVRSGGLQAGRSVSNATRSDIRATTGNQDFDGILSAGYAIWVDPDPSASDRDNRIARFKIWATGAPAVHEIIGDILFTN